MRHIKLVLCTAGFLALASSALAQTRGVQAEDLIRLRSVAEVAFSPDGSYLAYTVISSDRPGRPYAQLMIRNMASGESVRLGGEKDSSFGPEWSPDGRWLAFKGMLDGKFGLMLAKPDGGGIRFLAETRGTNGPLPSTGKSIAWSPDGSRIAFVSSVPGPETTDATGDPVVITRYIYKPDYEEGSTRFNDNRRMHIFVVSLNDGKIKQLTTGDHYEHSLDWSPNGEELLFVSNREPNEDQFFNYDIFALRLSDNSIRRITATESAEYEPLWSPDGKTIVYRGTRRGLTDLETTMEDTHIWLINSDGGGRREIGAGIDNRQGTPHWSPDGRYIWFTALERGNVRLCRLAVSGGNPEIVINEPGSVGTFSLSKSGQLAYTFASPTDLAQAFVRAEGSPSKKITDLNASILRDRALAEVEPFTFISNDFKFEVEAYLTKPLGVTGASKHPLIVVIHGGPHGQQGPALNFKNQVYAARGWATLMVNYRGSTGYGQKFADAVFGDQNGNEGQDVLYGVSAALRRYLWIDRDRLGIEGVSYGGQLSMWLITQTNMFKAAIPIAGISNLISYNYTTYYNQYEQMEWGIFPHQGNMMDVLWERSALKHVANAKTPTMLMHGENDSDVPITESEQFYVALRDVGVPAIMVRYPREGHGLREPGHIVDMIGRCISWYEKHFPANGTPIVNR